MAGKSAAAAATTVKKPKVLTEQDLLKASDKDYMNETQLAFFKQRLLDLRDQMLQNADDTGQHLRENEITTDPSDRATLEEEYTLELRTRDRERKLLKKVEKSLRMIDEGTYGYCEETGEPIGIPRLLARPTATLSLEAQERRERVQKLYGD
jgi:DnaK suppressor protein